ncbi:hypothetical protein HK102_002923, partial [Quaeritorhiza haematococci]
MNPAKYYSTDLDILLAAANLAAADSHQVVDAHKKPTKRVHPPTSTSTSSSTYPATATTTTTAANESTSAISSVGSTTKKRRLAWGLLRPEQEEGNGNGVTPAVYGKRTSTTVGSSSRRRSQITNKANRVDSDEDVRNNSSNDDQGKKRKRPALRNSTDSDHDSKDASRKRALPKARRPPGRKITKRSKTSRPTTPVKNKLKNNDSASVVDAAREPAVTETARADLDVESDVDGLLDDDEDQWIVLPPITRQDLVVNEDIEEYVEEGEEEDELVLTDIGEGRGQSRNLSSGHPSPELDDQDVQPSRIQITTDPPSPQPSAADQQQHTPPLTPNEEEEEEEVNNSNSHITNEHQSTPLLLLEIRATRESITAIYTQEKGDPTNIVTKVSHLLELPENRAFFDLLRPDGPQARLINRFEGWSASEKKEYECQQAWATQNIRRWWVCLVKHHDNDVQAFARGYLRLFGQQPFGISVFRKATHPCVCPDPPTNSTTSDPASSTNSTTTTSTTTTT